jgi:hypothetical protein
MLLKTTKRAVRALNRLTVVWLNEPTHVGAGRTARGGAGPCGGGSKLRDVAFRAPLSAAMPALDGVPSRTASYRIWLASMLRRLRALATGPHVRDEHADGEHSLEHL